MITQTITGFSGTPPNRNDPTNFSERSDLFVTEMAQVPPEVNTWAGQANALAVTVNDNVALSAAYAVTAQEAADAVVAQGTAAAYNAGTSYSQWAVAIGSDGRVYRRTTAGSGVNPATDLTGVWIALNPDPMFLGALVLTGAIYPGWSCQAQDSDGTYPPTNPASPAQYVFSRGVERYKAAVSYRSSGPAVGAIDSVTFTRSINSGGAYSSIGANDILTITYDAEGYPIAQAWS
jgi:hypothetical protein